MRQKRPPPRDEEAVAVADGGDGSPAKRIGGFWSAIEGLVAVWTGPWVD